MNLKVALRIAVLIVSISLLIGSVWLAQKQQPQSSIFHSSKSMTLPAEKIMSGSKSFNGTIVNRVDGQVLLAPRKP